MPQSYLEEHYGDLASVAGLLISVVGFVVTIFGVWKARRAAEEARQAAREAVSRVGSQLLVIEGGVCLQAMRGLDAACRERNWTIAIHYCDEAQTGLARLRENL